MRREVLAGEMKVCGSEAERQRHRSSQRVDLAENGSTSILSAEKSKTAALGTFLNLDVGIAELRVARPNADGMLGS